MILVEFHLDHPVLREALQRTPEMRIEWERSDILESRDRIRVLLWASGGDFEAFERGLDADPTVTPPSRTVDLGESRLYQLELVDEGWVTSIYPLVSEGGMVIQHCTATHEGWEFRIGFPDSRSISDFFEFCSEQDIGYTIRRIFEEQAHGEQSDFGLSAPQREALATALDIGYFDVPRENDLRELGDELEISDSAASQRLRRGVKTLLEETVFRDVEEPTSTPQSK